MELNLTQSVSIAKLPSYLVINGKVLTSGDTLGVVKAGIPDQRSVAENINWRLAVVVRVLAITAVVIWVVEYVECNVLLHFYVALDEACASIAGCFMSADGNRLGHCKLLFLIFVYHESCSKIICRRPRKITAL